MQQTVQSYPPQNSLNTEDVLQKAHRRLAAYNQGRLEPRLPHKGWRKHLMEAFSIQGLECELIEYERRSIAKRALTAPTNAGDFLDWFRELRRTGPGQHDPLFEWLADKAGIRQMTWFIQQELAGEAGFEDLTALAQLKFAPQPKLEMARNYWDEMGRGKLNGMHGPMLGDVARELGLAGYNVDCVEVEPLMLSNILLGLAYHRQYAFHALGALGVIELTAPDRSACVYRGLERLGLSPAGQRYFRLHSVIDVKHSEDWEKNVLYPVVAERPETSRAIAEGALMRLAAGERCFEKYRKVLLRV